MLLFFTLLFEAAQTESLSSDFQQFFPRFYKTLECLFVLLFVDQKPQPSHTPLTTMATAQSGSQSAGLPRDSMTRR